MTLRTGGCSRTMRVTATVGAGVVEQLQDVLPGALHRGVAVAVL